MQDVYDGYVKQLGKDNLKENGIEDIDDFIDFIDDMGDTEYVNSADKIFSQLVDFIPIVGEIKCICDAIVGEDIITKEQLSTYERIASGVVGAAGLVGYGVLINDAVDKGIIRFTKAEGVSKADTIIDGLKVVDGKVNGKIPIEDYNELRKLSIHNKESESLTLGKYRPTINADGTENWKIPGPDSYNVIAKKDNSMYFDMGKEYDIAMDKYDLTYQEMFDYFNVPALDEAASTGKVIRFTHNPELPKYKGSFTELEWKYLQEKYDYLYLREEGGIWYAEK